MTKAVYRWWVALLVGAKICNGKINGKLDISGWSDWPTNKMKRRRVHLLTMRSQEQKKEGPTEVIWSINEYSMRGGMQKKICNSGCTKRWMRESWIADVAVAFSIEECESRWSGENAAKLALGRQKKFIITYEVILLTVLKKYNKLAKTSKS